MRGTIGAHRDDVVTPITLSCNNPESLVARAAER